MSMNIPVCKRKEVKPNDHGRYILYCLYTAFCVCVINNKNKGRYEFLMSAEKEVNESGRLSSYECAKYIVQVIEGYTCILQIFWLFER